MAVKSDLLTIGELAARSGVATSALRFYEEKGLLSSQRTSGNQRRYERTALRRVAVIRAAQSLGISLASIRGALRTLPDERTPNRQDWEKLSRRWQSELDRRITELERLRSNLSSCIGCGCLSLRTCALFNPNDRAARKGPGPRYLLGDKPTA
ncbi:MAG: redox-sensitive transcriptional activator SoxR [Acidimicrobiia bacterium]